MTLPPDVETPQPQPELAEPEWEDIEIPPGDIYSEEPPLEGYLHLRQLLLLLKCLDWLWQERTDYFAAGNLSIYFSPEQIKSKDFRGPDFFVVLDTERKPRKSWVVWEEGGKYPHVIIELLSNSAARRDRTIKKQIDQDIFRTPEYFWFYPETLEFEGFHLVEGEYQPLQPSDRGHFWSHQLQLFLGVHREQLRFFTPEGELVPTPEESAQTERLQREATEQQVEVERQQKEVERQQKEAERQRNQKLVDKLRELGIDPDTL